MAVEFRALAALAAALSLAFAPAAPAAAQESSPWRIVAEDGACSVLYSPEGVLAHGFSWAPSGELDWIIVDMREQRGRAQPIQLQVASAIGETFSGATEASGDKDMNFHSLLGTDRRNARLIVSGDLTFSYTLGGRRIVEVVPAGVQAPRIAACMAQARAGKTDAASAPAGRRAPAETPPDEGRPRVIATGSGVFIDGRGSLVTNAHVVAGCKAVGSPALGRGEVIAIDEASDLALLRFKRTGAFARLRESGVRLGEPVVAAGFPLQSVLANGLNITLGNVSALSGIQGDRRYIQISAPVQPGNSGGALLDTGGRLIGVVVARLSEEAAPAQQNINFAVAPYVVGAFLRENGVVLPPPGAPAADVPAAAKSFTAYLECVG